MDHRETATLALDIEARLACTRSEMIGQPIHILAPPERRAERADLIRHVTRGVDRCDTVRK